MLSKLFNALEKTRFSLLSAFKNIKQGKISLDDLEKIEEQLLLADVGLDTVENIIDILKKFSDDNHHARVREYLLSQLPEKFTPSHNDSPVVIMMVGVNGTGKTTSAAKLAKLYSKTDCYISVSKYEGFGMSLANALIIKKPIITFFTNTILNTLGKKGVIYFKKFEVNDLRNIIIKNILNKKNFKKLNIDIHKNKRYLLTPLESAKKFVKLI